MWCKIYAFPRSHSFFFLVPPMSVGNGLRTLCSYPSISLTTKSSLTCLYSATFLFLLPVVPENSFPISDKSFLVLLILDILYKILYMCFLLSVIWRNALLLSHNIAVSWFSPSLLVLFLSHFWSFLLSLFFHC